MAINVVQSASVSSSAASPTTLTPTLGINSTAGNLVLIAACATGASPTLSPPNNWTVASSYNDATLAVAIFIRPNNPGSLGAIPFNLTASGGGATATIMEIDGNMSGLINQIVVNNQNNGTGTALANITDKAMSYQPTSDTLMLLLVGRVAASLTSPTFDNSASWTASVSPAVSTNGVPNAQHDVFVSESPQLGPSPSFTGTLGSSVHWASIFLRLTSINSVKANYTSVGGSVGILAGQFYQGMIGG